MINVQKFLETCSESTQTAYQQFEQLLAELEDPSTREKTKKSWESILAQMPSNLSPEDSLKQYHFCIMQNTFHLQKGTQTSLSLLVLPSTFAPEEWSFTFFEGLARFDPIDLRDRMVIELGCGIGWITLALAQLSKPSMIFGLDINPKAILCSKINLLLNSNEDPTLLERVQFHQSDLLEFFSRDAHKWSQKFDRIIGCIPQVLNPDPNFAQAISSTISDQELHDMSNYTVNQGQAEDQFGLGLIARAIEESVDYLRPSGKLILNLGGRPGTEILTKMFSRRGFRVRPIWRTRVSQAKDTNIQQLVSIEENTPHRFAFFTQSSGDVPISAKTAQAYVNAGGKIEHALTVYEGSQKDPRHTPHVLQFLRTSGYENARNLLDLSYSSDELTHEKLSFLTTLADYLSNQHHFPYEATLGLATLRKDLASFFNEYFQIEWHEKNFLITANRIEVYNNIIETYRPQLSMIDAQMATQIQSFKHLSLETLEIPRNSEVVCELIEQLKPKTIFYCIPPAEALTPEPFQRLCEAALHTESQLFIDISEILELSSNPEQNGVMRALNKQPLPAHVSIFGGLVKNKLYADLEICFFVTKNQSLLHALESTAELTYCRTPVLSQIYYRQILHDLLSFRMTARSRTSHLPEEKITTDALPSNQKPALTAHLPHLAKNAQEAFAHPAICEESLARKANLIRFDYGENALPTSRKVHESLFEAYTKMEINAIEGDCTPEVREILKKRFKFNSSEPLDLIYGNGAAPLFSSLTRSMAAEKITLIFPQGSYGHFQACAIFHGAQTITIPTSEQNRFKLDPKTLDLTLSTIRGPTCTILSAPIVNPTGAQYSAQELKDILTVITKHRGRMLLDCIFSGLEFNPEQFEKIDLTLCDASWIILGGISKEFAAGGLRIGYLTSSDPQILSTLRLFSPAQPHVTLKYALKNIYSAQLQKNPDLMRHQNAQRLELQRRAHHLCHTLRQAGWTPLIPDGGLFLVAKPPVTQGKQPDFQKLHASLRDQAGVVVNPPSWTGIPNYFRFVFSTERSDFDEGIQRLSLNA